MSRVIEVTLQCLESDSGDRTYQVTTRHGSTGELVPRFVLHDSHSWESAFSELKRAARAAIHKRMGELTPAYPERCKHTKIEKGES